MAKFVYESVIVTGSNIGDVAQKAAILYAHEQALALFEDGLVSPLTPVGHNFVQSFCVFPCGGGAERPAQEAHRSAIGRFCDWLSTTSELDYVATYWSDEDEPRIMRSHDSVQF